MNIVFRSIHAYNFLSLGDVTVDLSEQGYVIVNGQNRESSVPQSNGSGKSSIFDAIFWTITGETLRGCSDVVNDRRKKEGCFCDLAFTVDDTEYRILRSKSHKDYGSTCLFYSNDELLSDQVKKSQEMISTRIPSASSDIIGSIILLGQGLPYKFSSLSPIKRKDLLEIMSGSSSQIDKLKYQLDQEESEYETQKSKWSGDKLTAAGKISGLEVALQSIIDQQDAVSNPEELRKTIEENNSKIKELQSSLEESQKSSEEIRQVLDQYRNSEKSLREYIIGQTSEVNQIRGQLNSIKSGNCPTCGRPYEVSQETESLRRSYEEDIKRRDAMIVQLQAKLTGVQSVIKETESQYQNKVNTSTSFGYQIQDLQIKTQTINETLKVSESLGDKRQSVEREIKDNKIIVHDAEGEIDKIQEMLDCIAYLKRQLSRDFKGYMLEEVIKFLSSRAEYYGDFLFSTGKKVEVSLDGNKILITIGGRLYENLSGGERQRVDLAVQFALRDMLMITSGFSCNLLVLDEAFDNLDAQGSESLVNLVTSEFSDIDSVFIITHHADIAIPYDKSLTVVKNPEGVSSIEIA